MWSPCVSNYILELVYCEILFQVEPQVSGGTRDSRGQPQTRVSKRRSRSSLNKTGSHGSGRESPIGAEREREFPTTKIGASSISGEQTVMGNNDDRGFINYHGHGQGHGRCTAGHNGQHTPGVQPRSVITGTVFWSLYIKSVS